MHLTTLLKIFMKHAYKTALFFGVLFFSNILLFAQTNSFYVYFKQGEKRINIEDYQVELKREPFQIFIEYTNPIDIWINSSSSQGNFLKASKGVLYYQIPGFSGVNDPESFFLNTNTITLDENRHFIWKKSDTHGNLNYKDEKGRYVCFIDIKYLMEVEDAKVYKIEDFEKNIFMVFIYPEKDKDGEYIEIQREIVKIKWVDLYDENTKAYQCQKKQLDKSKIAEAKQELKRKQKLAKKEEKALKKLEEKKLKKEEKEKKIEEKEKKKSKE
jgi:hypothetical protein